MWYYDSKKCICTWKVTKLRSLWNQYAKTKKLLLIAVDSPETSIKLLRSIGINLYWIG